MDVFGKKLVRVGLLILLDLLSLVSSFFLSNLLIFGGIEFILFQMVLGVTIVKILTFFIFDIYNTMWKYASIEELFKIIVLIFTTNLLIFVGFNMLKLDLSVSVVVIMTLLDLIFIGGIRLTYRFLRLVKYNIVGINRLNVNVVIVGAGSAGRSVSKDIKEGNRFNYKIIGFVDDDINKYRQWINGTKVLGTIDEIDEICKKNYVREILIAIPSAKQSMKKRIIEKCKTTNCKIRTIPDMKEIIDGNVSVNQIREVQIEDLLGRDEINLNVKDICGYIKNKRVLVTGGGGSIGSELCRQIASLNPELLVLLDIYENNAYEVQQEILRKFPIINLRVMIASVRDKERIFEIFDEVKPQVVFHAAAHKHVPLMEQNHKAAIKNNVFGTFNVAQASDRYKVEKFVLISTDKAVNPTNIMGATKRLCEMIIQSMNIFSETEYVAVRFGNVLGSNGSVIPLFKKQIALGGPVTITHPDIIRYFMSIPEAVQLVLQAGSMAKGGEIFILDMGEPVKIADLAKDLIRLSGLVPEVDIKIEYVGLRPGEKLYEELLLDDEGVMNTPNEKIFVGCPSSLDFQEILSNIHILERAIKHSDIDLREILMQIVPTYQDADVANSIVLKKYYEETAVSITASNNNV